MSSVSSIAGSQQQYFQISQNQTKPAPTNQSAPADTSHANAAATSQTAPADTSHADIAATNQTAANSSAPKTQAATSQNVNPPQIVGKTSGTKSFESAATRNGDGTFGPKHTLRPPLSYTLLHHSSPAPASVDVKA